MKESNIPIPCPNNSSSSFPSSHSSSLSGPGLSGTDLNNASDNSSSLFRLDNVPSNTPNEVHHFEETQSLPDVHFPLSSARKSSKESISFVRNNRTIDSSNYRFGLRSSSNECERSATSSSSDANCNSISEVASATLSVDEIVPSRRLPSTSDDGVKTSVHPQSVTGDIGNSVATTSSINDQPANPTTQNTTTKNNTCDSGTTTTTKLLPSSGSDGEMIDYPDHLVCAICLELLFSPICVKPCCHVFCEPCLRRLARPCPTNTACPLCREVIGACQPAAGECITQSSCC